LTESDTDNLQPTRFESIFEAVGDSGGLGEAFACASRSTRAQLSGITPDEAVVRDVGAGVLAPAMTGFCLWLLHRAEALGLRRLYFLSRDGHLVLEVARALAPRLGLNIDLRYLLCSRKAFVPACVTATTPEQLAMAFEDSPVFSVRVCFERLGIAPETVSDALSGGGFPEESWGRNLSSEARTQLQHVVVTAPAVSEAVIKNASSLRDVLWDFLVQEGLLDGTPFGLVDLGWKASTQRALVRLLATQHGAAGGAPVRPHGLYFGLDCDGTVGPAGLDAEGYFADGQRQTGFWRNDLPQLAAILEPMCTIGHGTVTGYQRKDGRVEAVLAPSASSVYEKWHFDVLRKTVRCFAQQIVPTTDMAREAGVLTQPVYDAVVTLWMHPDLQEAKVWGVLPLGDRLGAIDFSDQYAKRHGWPDVLRTLSDGVIREPEGSIWFAGSFVQDSALMRLVLRIARRVGGAWSGLLRLFGRGRTADG
jgi:hypothetical protein